MGLRDLLMQYGPPVGITALVLVACLALAALGASRGVGPGLWRGVRAHLATTLLLSLALLFGVGLAVYFEKAAAEVNLRQREQADLLTPTNLITDPLFTSVGALTSTLNSWVTNRPASGAGTSGAGLISLYPGWSITSTVVVVQPGNVYRYSFSGTAGEVHGSGDLRVRMLWLDKTLTVLSWDDANYTFGDDPLGSSQAFRTQTHNAPIKAAALQIVFSNVSSTNGSPVSGALNIQAPVLSANGVYVEPHPNGTQGSNAFSFDWETAMGGAIHSKGMETHDPAGAAQHGLDMRQGADWLAKLFADNNIKATFYATGYNLLDGNTEHRTFSGDPIYKWANQKDGWATDYWTTHKWYGDDPYGTVQTQPAWYFGDQARALLGAGHEIASHTFGHLYVRGTTPEQLSTDMNEWLSAAKAVGVPAPTTFAFPWRSSNSLTPDFYDVFYKLGIRAVTRIYAPDIKDLYTLGAAYGTSNKQPWEYPNIAVMPDFLLGTPSATMGEENAGAALTADQGLQVISQTLQRRGTTSFWQHPEQLAADPSLSGVRDAWTKDVTAAAHERDNGRLWIATVADITAYQRDVMSVTTSLDSSWFGGWKLTVNNDSGKILSGVTLTLPGDARSATSGDVAVNTVTHPQSDTTRVSPAGKPVFPARQLVLDNLKPGQATIQIDWASGQEPVK